jgi:hypothetical protein
MAVRARLTLEPGGAVCLTSGYDRQFVDDLKRAIPWDGRSWDAARKVWIIHALYAPDLVDFLQQAGAQVQDDRDTGTGDVVAVPAMPADLRKAFDTLTLAYTAPLGLANVAFKFYARFSDHDDAGGSIDFRQMNDAIQTIRKYLDPKKLEIEEGELPF